MAPGHQHGRLGESCNEHLKLTVQSIITEMNMEDVPYHVYSEPGGKTDNPRTGI